GQPGGGISCVRSLMETFSHASSSPATCSTSIVSSINPAVFSVWLWHGTQYVLRTSLGEAGEGDGCAAMGADWWAPRSSPTPTTRAAAYAVMTLEAGDRNVIFAPGPAMFTSPSSASLSPGTPAYTGRLIVTRRDSQ